MTRLTGKVAVVTGGGRELGAFLASEESSWMTVTAIPLDGGLSAY